MAGSDYCEACLCGACVAKRRDQEDKSALFLVKFKGFSAMEVSNLSKSPMAEVRLRTGSGDYYSASPVKAISNQYPCLFIVGADKS